MLLPEVNLDAGPARVVDGSLELLDFLELGQVGLHLLHQHVHLLQRTAVGQGGGDRQDHLPLVAVEVTAVVHLLHEQAQAAAQHLVGHRLHLLFVRGRAEDLVVPRRPVPLSLQFLRQQEHRQAEG